MLTWGQVVGRRAWAILLGGLVVVLGAAVFGVGAFGQLSDGGFDDPGSESARELALEQSTFGGHESDVVAIYSSRDLTVTDGRFESAVQDVVAGLPRTDVQRAVTWYDTQAPSLVSADRHATRVVITLRGESQDAKTDDYAAIKDDLAADGLRTDVGGAYAVFSDVNTEVSSDISRAESLSMPIVFLLSLVIFGSLVSALMPTLVGGIAVFGAFAVVRLITGLTDVSVFAINVITLLGMGLAIDYALFVVSRFREELAAQPDATRPSVNVAVARTMATAGRTVLFSGLIVASSLASLLLFPQNFLRSMGFGGVAAVLVAMVAALTVLPALLTVLGPRIELGRMPWRREGRRVGRHAADAGPLRASRPESYGAWARLAHSVMRRPVAYLVVIVVALVALGSPFLGARWGSVDERVLPSDAPSRVASQVMADRFGGVTSSANIVVRGADRGDLSSYTSAIADLPEVRSVQVTGTTVVSGDPTSLVEVTWSGDGQTQASQQLVKDIRAISPGDGATALVGGTTAETVDLVSSIRSHLPWMALTVVLVMLVLLFLAFGSVVLPIKAVVMNAISLGASFGVVTWIFQDGHLSGLLGFTSPGYLDVTQPILMLAIVFGLSMDYEVFLISRMREEWDRTGDNRTAVAAGLQRSGRIITSAALLLAVVIGGFSTSGIIFLKMIGVGMLVAVILDATVVRALLVPATMRLLGRANWWAPGPMRRWWQRHGHHESGPADTSTSTPVTQELDPVRAG